MKSKHGPMGKRKFPFWERSKPKSSLQSFLLEVVDWSTSRDLPLNPIEIEPVKSTRNQPRFTYPQLWDPIQDDHFTFLTSFFLPTSGSFQFQPSIFPSWHLGHLTLPQLLLQQRLLLVKLSLPSLRFPGRCREPQGWATPMVGWWFSLRDFVGF